MDEAQPIRCFGIDEAQPIRCSGVDDVRAPVMGFFLLSFSFIFF